MKKGIIVLLIAVLVAGFAFAADPKFSGSATVSYGVVLKEDLGYGFSNSQKADFKFDFEFASASKEVSEHSTDFWAEIAASASAGYVNSSYKLNVEISKALIHIKDFAINILGPKAPYNYAASWTKTKATATTPSVPCFDFANDGDFDKAAVGGIEIQYEGFSFSIAQNKTFKDATKEVEKSYSNLVWISDADWAEMKPKQKESYEATSVVTTDPAGKYYAQKVNGKDAVEASSELVLFLGGETKKFELAEGLTIKFAGNALLYGKKDAYRKLAGLGLNIAYKTEDIGASLAVDAQYTAKTLSMDFLAKGNYKKLVDATAYFGLSKKFEEGEKLAKVLEVKASSQIPVGENTITVSAEADRLFNAKKPDGNKAHFNKSWAGYTVKVSAKIGNFAPSAYFNYNQAIDAINKGKTDVYGMNAGLDLAYTAKVFTAKAGASLNFIDVGTEKAITPYAVKPTASISTTKPVENCTLSLAWTGARITLDDTFKTPYEHALGTITASATVAF